MRSVNSVPILYDAFLKNCTNGYINNPNSGSKYCNLFVESLICDFGFTVVKFPSKTNTYILPLVSRAGTHNPVVVSCDDRDLGSALKDFVEFDCDKFYEIMNERREILDPELWEIINHSDFKKGFKNGYNM